VRGYLASELPLAIKLTFPLILACGALIFSVI
jgi:hypothetical protein